MVRLDLRQVIRAAYFEVLDVDVFRGPTHRRGEHSQQHLVKIFSCFLRSSEGTREENLSLLISEDESVGGDA